MYKKKKQTDQCEHPKHEAYFEAFLKKYPTANKDAHFAINLVYPEEWWVSDDPKKNTVRCCQMSGISEGIARSSYRNISTINQVT